jgi:hypothetical protein
MNPVSKPPQLCRELDALEQNLDHAQVIYFRREFLLDHLDLLREVTAAAAANASSTLPCP